MSSNLRYYDEAVQSYCKELVIESDEYIHIPQVITATPSSLGANLNITESFTPEFPFIVILRTGLTPVPETKIVNSHITRPLITTLNTTETYHDGIELMPYSLSYQIDYFNLTHDLHNLTTENFLFRLTKHHYVKVIIGTQYHNIKTNCYISNVSFSENLSSMVEIPNSSNRIFQGTVSFSLYGYLIDTNYAKKSVINIKHEIEVKD